MMKKRITSPYFPNPPNPPLEETNNQESTMKKRITSPYFPHPPNPPLKATSNQESTMKKRITSPYFPDPPKPPLEETNNQESTMKKRITSPYFPNPPKPKRITSHYFKPKIVEFNNPKPEPSATSPLFLQVESKRITSPYFNNPKPSTTTSPPQVEPKRIISPYFNNPKPSPHNSPPQVVPKRITSPYFNNPKPSATTYLRNLLCKSTANPVDDIGDGIEPPLPSLPPPIESFRYIPPFARRSPPASAEIITAKAETDAVAASAASTPVPASVEPHRNICQCRGCRCRNGAAEHAAAATPMSSPPPKKKRKRTSIVLTARQKRDEAYRRQTAEERTWEPPHSVHSLLQEDHAHDPWRVIVICMLLNCTTGHQVVFPASLSTCISSSPIHMLLMRFHA